MKIGQPRPAATKSSGPTSAEDYAIISDLLETVEHNPESVEAHRILAQQYEAFGWLDAAADIIRTILALEPGDPTATAWLTTYLHGGGSASAQQIPRKPTPRGVSNSFSKKTGNLQDLEKGYKTWMSDAQDLVQELLIFQEMSPDLNIAGQIADLKAMAEGRFTSVIKVKPPPAARSVATKIIADESNAADIAFADLEASARWIRSQAASEDPDKTRDAVRKRAQAIKAALPKNLSNVPNIAFMHVEHEMLGKMYQNDGGQTMLGDFISEIPRSNFWVSEDGFAWDMSELAEALKVNQGIMRNPLSKQLFTADDVRSIVRHPLGKHLAALQLKQQQLTKGVRKETVERLDQMAGVLLSDQSADATASREAVDEFLVFAATLPEAEQDALNNLRAPATDSHTGRSFDVTIGDAVADAKANRQCFHKTGDHLRHAAKHLRKSTSSALEDAKMSGAWS